MNAANADNTAANGCPEGAADSALGADTIAPGGRPNARGAAGDDTNVNGDLDIEAAGGGPMRIQGAGQGATTIDAQRTIARSSCKTPTPSPWLT